ncbi:MAG: hypothetical protein ACTS6A_01240 [Candidatus Hodgkinia cicadicola]
MKASPSHVERRPPFGCSSASPSPKSVSSNVERCKLPQRRCRAQAKGRKWHNAVREGTEDEERGTRSHEDEARSGTRSESREGAKARTRLRESAKDQKRVIKA